MPEQYVMTWNEVYERLLSLRVTCKGKAVYGVPRGGAIVAGMMAHHATDGLVVVSDPSQADVIVDDIIDSGATRDRFPGKPFIALVDKTDPDKNLGWLVFPWEGSGQEDIEDTVRRWLEYIGEEPNREGLLETPARVVRSWKELYAGYDQDPATVLKVFEDGACDEMVILRNIDFYSTCEHHLLPFFGKCHIGYIPQKKIVGLSKLARLVEVFARRLQVQENLTQQIAHALQEHLSPLGVIVVMEGRHLCMCARGVEKINGIMTTSALQGAFKENPETRAEFYSLLRRESW